MDKISPNDIDLAFKVQNHKDNESLKEIINRHTPLCLSIYNKYAQCMSVSGVSCSDLLNEKDYIIYDSVMKFKPEKGVKLSTWIGEQVRYYCLNYVRKNHNGIVLSPEKIQDLAESQDKPPDNTDITITYILELLEQLKDKRIMDIYKMRYFDKSGKKKTWTQIGNKLGFSAEHVRNLHNRAAEFLKNKMSGSIFMDTV